jgi:NADPH-dependent 2,4-dienoyl-CoA reductase/sulfur reductase-like enzyme
MNRRDFIRGGAIAATAMPLFGVKAAERTNDECKAQYETDVLVLGGGPAGVCAALSAARNGAKVLLVEQSGMLGGMATLGLVGPFMTCYDKAGEKKERETYAIWSPNTESLSFIAPNAMGKLIFR